MAKKKTTAAEAAPKPPRKAVKKVAVTATADIDLPDDPSYIEQNTPGCPACGSVNRSNLRSVYQCRSCGKVYPK